MSSADAAGNPVEVAVLGLGQMGSALAARLVDGGHHVRIWNRTAGKAGELAARGAIERKSPAEAASDAEVVLASLTDDEAVRSVLVPRGQPLATGPDVLVVDCSTVSPATTRILATSFPRRFVSAPILGAPDAVASGAATLVLAGPPEAVDRLAPVWEAVAGRTIRCGDDPVRASEVKLLNNYLLLSGIAALAEVVAAGQQAGLDDRFLAEFLTGSPLVATGLHNRLGRVISGDGRGWFGTALGAKDLQLVRTMADELGLDLPLAAAVHERYCRAAERGAANDDVADVVSLYRP